jgi:Ferritin-like domain
MNRRRFLLGSAGLSAAALGGPWVGTSGAATEDDLAYANFGVSAEFLLKQFYERALTAKQFGGRRANVLGRGRLAATNHTSALSKLLGSFGDAPPLEEDFEFVWPRRAFAGARETVRTGLVILHELLGAYQTAAATSSVVDYRILYASLAASVSEQAGALSALVAPAGARSFPAAMDIETASARVEAYVG